jgi:transposase
MSEQVSEGVAGPKGAARAGGERPIAHIAQDLGIGAETLRKHVRRAQRNAGKREGLSTNERAELERLRRENFELRANTILEEASVFSRRSSITL